MLGAVYLVEAVKRVRGMRLVGMARRRQVSTRAAPAVVANRQNPRAWRLHDDWPAPPASPRTIEPLETE